MNLVFNNTWPLAELTAAIDTGGALETVTVDLFQNDVEPSPNSVIGDFDVCDYDGYAAEAVVWSDPSIADDGSPEIIGIVGEFRPTGATTPNVAFGMLLRGAAGVLLAAGRFDPGPLPMSTPLDVTIVTPRLRSTPSGPVAVVS